jgi:hypothetical protein
MLLRERTRPGSGIFEPSLPYHAKAPPSGSDWVHDRRERERVAAEIETIKSGGASAHFG